MTSQRILRPQGRVISSPVRGMVDVILVMVVSTSRGMAAAVWVLLTSPVVAQAPLPLPASHVAMEGTTFTNVPFGRSTPTRVRAGAHTCGRVRAGVRGRVCVGVAGVRGFSNNYEFSEYLLETNVFMQWPLIRILFEFFPQI